MILENAMCLLKIVLIICLVTASVLFTIRWSDKGTYVSFINWEEFKDLAEKLIKGKITEEQFNEGIKTKGVI